MIILVDGLPASGKSTLVREVHRQLVEIVGDSSRVVVLRDPLEDHLETDECVFRCCKGKGKGKINSEATLLFRILSNEETALKLDREEKYVIMERSLSYAYRTFVHVWMKDRSTCKEDRRIHKGLKFYPMINRDYVRMWVRTSTATCMRRLRSRKRPGDSIYSRDHLVSMRRAAESLRVAEQSDSVIVNGASVWINKNFAGKHLPEHERADTMVLSKFLSNLVSKQV